jgi:hypothetical protein
MNPHLILGFLCLTTLILSFWGSDIQKGRIKFRTPQQAIQSLDLNPIISNPVKKNASRRPCSRRNVGNLPSK